MELNKIFSSNMVFAAKKPIRIYGTGKGNAEIEFADKKTTVVSSEEEWNVEFEAMEYGGPYSLRVAFDDRTVVFDNIYIGEVFLFSGQSNMEFKMKETNILPEKYVSNEKVRLYSTDRIENRDKFKADDGWVVCDKADVGEWSALAYMISNKISEEKNIAVGAIACYQGASVIESWVPEKTFENINIKLTEEEKFCDHTCEAFSKWNGDGVLYSFALSQVIPYSLSGVVWYQGESDASTEEGMVYCDELCALIDIWRKDFRDENLPFIVIQIADTEHRMTEGWKLVQKAQREAEKKRDFVKTVVSGDVCETDEIHPPTKDKLAERVAVALKAYV